MLSKPRVPELILALLLIISTINSYASIPFSPQDIPPQSVGPDSISTASVDTLVTTGNDTLEYESPLEAKVVYNATDSIRFDILEQKVYLFGQASVSYQEITLNASHIEYGFGDNVVYAYGRTDSLGNYVDRPLFNEGQSSFEADTMTYNFETKRGVIKEVKTQEGDGFLHSQITKKHANDHIHVSDGKYTTCSLDEPHYYFKLSKAVVVPNDKIVSGPTYLVVQDIPTPLAVPFGYFPNKSGESAGLIIPTYGEDANLGFFLSRGGYYWPLGDKFDTQLTGDIYSKGSWRVQNTTRYRNRYRFNGDLNLSYSIIKQGVPETESFSRNTEFFVRWSHQQDPKARPNSKFSANVNAGSSNNFREGVNANVNDFLTNTFQSNVTYNKTFAGTPFNFNASLRHNQNTNTGVVNLTLPEMALNMTRIYPGQKIRQWLGAGAVGSKKWYENIGLNYNTNFRNEINTGDSLISLNNLPNLLRDDFRYGMRHNVTANTSIKLFKRKAPFTLNPSINYVERWYLQTIEKRYDNELDSAITDTISGFARAFDYNMSAALTTNIYGFYHILGGHKIRHSLTPSVSFVYRPSFNSEVNGFFGDEGTLTSYSPFDIGIYGKPNSFESGVIGINLINALEGKFKAKNDSVDFNKVKIIENFNIATSYDIFADENNWGTVRLSGRTRLFKKLSLNYNGTFDPYDYDDSTGVALDNSAWTTDGGFGRFTSSTLAATMNFQSKKGNKGEKQSDKGTARELNYINANPQDFVDFNIPWSLYLSYNLNVRRFYSSGTDTTTVTQALNFNGDFNLTEKWKVGFSSGYDFTNKDFTNSSINIYRDLHCWEMAFDWIPFGALQRYEIRLNIKSAMLQDLKLSRRRSWYNQ